MKDNRIRVYVAGPYSKGDVALNVRDSIVIADRLLQAGFIPFVPHLSHFWHLVCPHPYPVWLDIDLVWLEQCEVVLRYPGASSGADGEVRHAEALGIPVFFSEEELVAHYQTTAADRLALPMLCAPEAKPIQEGL